MNDSQFTTWEKAVDWLVAQPDKLELVRACYFDPPLARAAERYWASEEWKAVRGWLPPTKGSALDVGAGMGIASYALAKDGWQVTAVEPDLSDKVGAGAIRSLAAREQLSIQVHSCAGEALPFEDRAFVAVHARQVLHHAKDLAQLCKELFRILKPGGRLVATRDHVITSQKQLPAFLAKHPLHRLYGGENAYRLQQYLQALRGAGFSVLKVLGPFDSPINLAPMTLESLLEELQKRIGKRIPGGAAIAPVVRSAGSHWLFLRILSMVDNRPGRLYSFVAMRP